MEKHWFRARKYGLGWVPATWQGWAITLLYALLVIGSAVTFNRVAAASPDAIGTTFASDMLVARFILWIIVLTIALLWINYKTGEPPHWHWGNK